MEKTFVVGNKPDNKWCASLPNATYDSIPSFSLGEDGEAKMSEYVSAVVPNDITACVIDVDNMPNIEICLTFAMTLRLSLFDKHSGALVPIIFVTRSDSYMFYGYKYSAIILTRGVVFEVPENIQDALLSVESLTAKEYIDNFLNIIKILPNATEGKHSLANQWGADILWRIVCGATKENEMIRKARLSLYFRYTLAQTLTSQQIHDIAAGDSLYNNTDTLLQIEAPGKKVLLIDDEAKKGWSDVLGVLLKGAELVTVCQKTSSYEDLPIDVRKSIEEGLYDLVFLDLRMNGIEEEKVLTPNEFSGMKILKAIKAVNQGIQVIMFTASNKAWNMKALLDAGADGYYIKESPEFAFPNSYSVSNANELVKSIKLCLDKGYLRDVYTKVRKVKDLIETNHLFSERTKEILTNIDVAYDLLAHSHDQAEYQTYAYLQLFLSIEEYVKLPSVFDLTDSDLYLYNGDKRYRILKDKVVSDRKEVSYDSIISMTYGHYVIKKGKYKNRFVDTNFLVSAILIYKFGMENSAVNGWTKVYKVRNDIAHSKKSAVSIDEFDRILNFMLYFFESANIKWRDTNQAFPDVPMEDSLKNLQNKYKQ
jgi:DNA-binding NarL/FixJ family response regulator